MATETVTEYETVEKEREIKVCDYCRLVSSEDISDDEEFHSAMLDPQVSVSRHSVKHIAKDMTRGLEEAIENLQKMEDANLEEGLDDIPKQMFSGYSIKDALERGIQSSKEDSADLCPNCADQLFGDGPVSMIRDATNNIEG